MAEHRATHACPCLVAHILHAPTRRIEQGYKMLERLEIARRAGKHGHRRALGLAVGVSLGVGGCRRHCWFPRVLEQPLRDGRQRDVEAEVTPSAKAQWEAKLGNPVGAVGRVGKGVEKVAYDKVVDGGRGA